MLDPTTAVRTSDHDGQVVTLGYVVTPVTAGGGSASPALRTVSKNGSAAFTFAPDVGHHFTSASDNCGAGGSFDAAAGVYTTGAVTTNCSDSATVALDTFAVSANAGSGGSVDPASRTVAYDTTTMFTFTPDAGFVVASASGCDGTLSLNVYTTGPITADCTVSVTFGPASYHVTPVAGPHGTITPSTTQTVGYKAVLSFTANPDPSYQTKSVSGCNATAKNNKITAGPITADCTLTVIFGK